MVGGKRGDRLGTEVLFPAVKREYEAYCCGELFNMCYILHCANGGAWTGRIVTMKERAVIGWLIFTQGELVYVQFFVVDLKCSLCPFSFYDIAIKTLLWHLRAGISLCLQRQRIFKLHKNRIKISVAPRCSSPDEWIIKIWWAKLTNNLINSRHLS